MCVCSVDGEGSKLEILVLLLGQEWLIHSSDFDLVKVGAACIDIT